MKVALYLRVSTKEQTTLNQELELRNYCKKEGHTIYNIYKDEGISGAKTTRPALDKMLQDMRQGKFEAVVVYKYDRLGRSTLHCLQTLEEMKNKNVRFIATSQNIDTGTPMGRWFVINLLGLAEMERELIRERINSGLDRAKATGKKLGRPAGSKDKKRRTGNGYYLRWAKERQVKDWAKELVTA